MRMPIVTTAPVFHKAREPIVPSIFDAISENPDSPAIVRYAMTTREISAASPARIITQVTSKNFLDYELLSDFFLTARAYLSTNDLLEYLLARFEWAINRFDDDGRVIRVRTFAAIRHWILNYFPYDFVVDRDLRVKFSERLNALTLHVRLRGHEASDLKLIIDLKKCWNGRCALYWDSPQEEIEGRIDHDISPGGIVGSRDSQLTHPNELWAKLAAASSNKIDPEKSAAALHNWVDSVIEAEVDGKSRSERQASVASPTHSASLLSDQTIPAMSCTVPGKTFKSFANQAGRNVGPHPVPVSTPTSTRRVCPPAPSAHVKERSSRKKSDHQRSGSFSDALRDKRTSLGAIHEGKSTEQVVMSLPFSGSLIRGSVFPPGSPFIPSDDVKSRGSGSSLKKEEQYPCLPPETHPMSPGVRSLLVYLRRAWGSKQNSVSTTPAIMPTAPFMIETKYSNLPMHIAYKIEGLGDQHNQLEALKNNARIDLLCADVTDMFERAMTQEEKQISAKPSKVSLASSKDIEVASRDSWQYLTTPEREGLRRNHSEVTTGSRSIVIMDDTSSQPPVPDLPRSFNKPHAPFSLGDQGGTPQYKPLIPPKSPERANRSGDTTQSSLQPEFTRPNPFRPHQQRESLNQGPPTSRISTQPRRPSVTTANSFRSTRSGSTSLRKYVSYQSGMRRSGPDQMFDPTNESSSSPGQVDRPPARMLRRRPGGDLRANENVNDMKTIPRPLSTGSITTYTDSMRYSSNYLQRMPHEANNRASEDDHRRGSTPVPKRSRSVEHDRSSRKKDLRPSFELAVAAFARIPDDEGGDLEATLLKLEGRFRRSPVGSSEGPSSARPTPPATSHSREQPPPIPQNGLCPNNTLLTPPPSAKRLGEPEVAKGQHDTTQSLYTASEGSYNSVPLLERGNENKRAQGSQAASDQLNETVPRPLFSPNDPYRKDRSESSAWGSEIDSTTRVRRGRYRSSIPTMTTDSFLLDEDEFLSDLSSELSDDEDFETDSVLEDAYGSAARTMQNHSMPSLPPNVGYASGYLPSPPMTTENAIAISSETFRMQEQRKPPTPEPSPVSRHTESAKSRTPNEVDGSVLQPFANKVHQFPPRRHIPFVLAFDATVLAQQFTLIERDALNEINWQDLIDLRWQQSSPTALNWVEFLRYQDPNGIDLVTARFNIVVKWALSEIVLTHNVEERAWTIMKFIRVAQHARKYHNYATMLQLTLALTSIDCTRMTKAWALVPEAERAAMKEMESLVSPLRNFHNLRAEMEAANFDDGCIPVVGKSCSLANFLSLNNEWSSSLPSRLDVQLAEAIRHRQYARRRASHQLRALPNHSNNREITPSPHRLQREIRLQARRGCLGEMPVDGESQRRRDPSQESGGGAWSHT